MATLFVSREESPSELMISCKSISNIFPNNCFTRNKREGLKSVSFQVDRNETFGIIGVNGAGKSTLLKIILGFVKPSSGEIKLAGRSPSNTRSQINIGYLPEHPTFYPNLSILEHLHFACRTGNFLGERGKSRIAAVLKRVGLDEVANTPIKRFSKGMTQRAALAYAILLEPDILILDEPMSGLDPLGRQLVTDIIQEFQAQNATILFCTHILSDAELLCNRIGIMHKGELRSIISTPFVSNNDSPENAPYRGGRTSLETLFFRIVQQP